MDELDRLANQAVRLHTQGQAAEASRLYEQVLAADPRHFDALHGLAILRAQSARLAEALHLMDDAVAVQPGSFLARYNRGQIQEQLKRLPEAMADYGQAISLRPDFAEAHTNRAAVLRRLGQSGEALASYRRAIAFRPEHPTAHSSLGNILQHLERYDEALTTYARAIALRPDFAEVHNNRAAVLRMLEQYGEALASCERAITSRPDYAEAHCNRGTLLRHLERYDEALKSCERAIALRPDFVEAHNSRAAALGKLERYHEALASCERAIAFQPEHAEAHSNRGHMLRRVERYDEALTSCNRAIALCGDLAEAYVNRGNVLAEFGRYAEAEASFDAAIALRPRYADAYHNRANVVRWQGRLEEALVTFDQAIACKADSPETLYAKGALLLLMGDFRAGLPLNEWRWQTAWLRGRQRDFRQPLWLGDESIAGKTLLLHNEQGLGDTVQFVRYVPLVEALGARVILEVQPPLIPLLRTLKGNARLVAQGEPLPEFDVHCSLMTLPLAFHTMLETIPAEIPYLFADPAIRAAWQHRLGERRRPRIGLAWSGNPTHVNDRNRSLPLSLLAGHLSREFEYHVIQKYVRPEDEPILRDSPHLHRHDASLTDFAETAALIAEMDLVLSVDTSIAHAAGALGKPVWILLPFYPDWRWLTSRSDSPWYPTARLFRQQRRGDWDSVLDEVTAELNTITGHTPHG